MKVGITFSTFDLFHAGHIKMLEEDLNKYLKEDMNAIITPENDVDTQPTVGFQRVVL